MLNILKCLALAALLGAGASAKDATLPRDGDYLSTAYLAALDKTRSHNKAGEVPAPQMVTVSRENGDVTLGAISNWHEGGGVFSIHMSTRANNEATNTDQTFTPIDTTHFRYNEGGGAGLQTFEYVGKVERYIAAKLLVGIYADAHGQRYVFGADGKAQFPRKTFRYEIYTDVVFENCDLVSDIGVSKPGAWKAYGFAWKGNTLFLYNADCNVEDQPGCVVDRAHPIAELHKVTPKK